jgi:hypothetical protein
VEIEEYEMREDRRQIGMGYKELPVLVNKTVILGRDDAEFALASRRRWPGTPDPQLRSGEGEDEDKPGLKSTFNSVRTGAQEFIFDPANGSRGWR